MEQLSDISCDSQTAASVQASMAYAAHAVPGSHGQAGYEIDSRVTSSRRAEKRSQIGTRES